MPGMGQSVHAARPNPVIVRHRVPRQCAALQPHLRDISLTAEADHIRHVSLTLTDPKRRLRKSWLPSCETHRMALLREPQEHHAFAQVAPGLLCALLAFRAAPAMPAGHPEHSAR